MNATQIILDQRKQKIIDHHQTALSNVDKPLSRSVLEDANELVDCDEIVR